MKNHNYLKKLCAALALTMSAGISQAASGLLISEFHVNPAGTDSPFEYVELRATQFINFAVTPYSVVVSNNGTATAAGWIAGGVLTYGFNINTGTVNAGDVVYVGGSSMVPTGIKLRMINTGTTTGDGFGNASTGPFGNGGGNADGIAVFAADISTLSNSSIPTDAVFYGTAVGSALVNAGLDGYQLPVNDLYPGGKLQATSFVAADPGALNLIASGTYDTINDVFTGLRSWTTGTLSDGTSSIILSSVLPPAALVFSADNQTTIESAGTITANIAISSSNSSPSSVDVVLLGFGTATDGSDHTFTTQTITFPANATGTLPVSISITDDLLSETSEYFVLKLQNPVNATLSGTASILSL